MKIFVTFALLLSAALAQSTTQTAKPQTKPAGATSGTQAQPSAPAQQNAPAQTGPGSAAPGTASPAKASPATASPGTPAAPPAPIKGQPMAKTKEEFDDFQAMMAQTDLNAAETAADAFAAKYTDSELRVPIFSTLMQKFQNADNADKTLVNAKKVLAIEPDNTISLVISSNVYAERTRETDLDREERFQQGMKNAQRAIDTIDTGLVVPPQLTPEQLAGAKLMLTSLAHSAMGYIEYQRKNLTVAEKHLQEAADLMKAKPDATTLYRLAVTQHAEKKFPEALANVSKAIDAAQGDNNPVLLKLAEEEKTKLAKAATPPK